MHVAGQFILAVFILWTMFTCIILMFTDDIYALFRSPGFIVLCVGYIAIIVGYSIYKHAVRDYHEYEEREYRRRY